MLDEGSQENRIYCQNVRTIGNLVRILFVFSPSNTIMRYDKIKSDMVYSKPSIIKLDEHNLLTMSKDIHKTNK